MVDLSLHGIFCLVKVVHVPVRFKKLPHISTAEEKLPARWGGDTLEGSE